jgi:hypothetical protein
MAYRGLDPEGSRLKRSEFLAAIPAALYALACGEEAPSTLSNPPATGGTGTATGGTGTATGGTGSGGGAASGTSGNGGTEPSGGAGGSVATPGTGGSGGTATGGTPTSSGGATSVPSWTFDCHDASLPVNTGALARSPDFSPNSETGAPEPHVLYLDGHFLIRRTTRYVTEGADHQHEIILTNDQIDQLIVGQTIVVETNGPPLNASSGHGHTITIRSCFIV